MQRILRTSLLVLLLASTSNGFAQELSTKLRQAFERFEKDSQTRYAISSLCVLDAETGKTLFAKNEDVGLATASTLKTITSATALGILGPDFTYQTTLAYQGNIDASGTLTGDLVIIGGGDPTLGSWRFQRTKEGHILDQWVSAIKEAGIKRITGKIIGDDGLWGSQTTPDGWIWQDIGNYYGAGPSSLSWRENQFDIHLKATAAGQNVRVLKTVPDMPYLQLINETQGGAAGTGDRVYVYLPPLASTAYLRGTWAVGIGKAGVSAALPDPAFEAAFRLSDTLNRVGITVSNNPTTTRKIVAEHEKLPQINGKLITISSPTLSEIVHWFNKKSINLYGEHMLKTLAWKSGKETSTKNGAAVVSRYWAERGIDRAALNIMDGSGLSPATRVTTSAMAKILFQAQGSSWFNTFYESLPVNNGMRIKSGTINDVMAYAGYYYPSSGKKYVVVINVNNYSGAGIRQKLFRVLDALK